MSTKQPVTVNGRTYAWPQSTLVVICCDGSEPAYTDQGMADGIMPNLKAMVERGANERGFCVVPSFTNPNNLSIVTGQPPSVHGICGNYLIDPDTGEEVMMNDPKFLRAPTIFKAFQDQGAKIAIITAKDKLRRLLGHGLTLGGGGAICFSSEKADQVTLEEHGIEDAMSLTDMPVPDVYSAELSEFIFAAGVSLLKSSPPDIMYLSTTDYVQHKHAPGSEGANAFYAMLDRYLGEMDALGATVVMTADHGMKAKHTDAGEPDVLYLQDVFDGWLGKDAARVILPITDPYVVHHGALGSFATVYLPDGADHEELAARVAGIDGIDACYTRNQGCVLLGLPPDRLGDLIVISGGAVGSKVVGTSADRHDLSGLNEPLRSHGGLSEQCVPVIINRPIAQADRPLRNFDAFDLGCNFQAGALGQADIQRDVA